MLKAIPQPKDDLAGRFTTLPGSTQPAAGAPQAGGNSKLPGPVVRYKSDFVVPASAVQLQPQADGTHTGKIEIALVAYDSNGTALNWTAARETMNPCIAMQ